jgi:hypothetical protein
MHRATIPANDRVAYLEKLRMRRDHYVSNGCNFWVFEEVGLHGAFIEFTEAGDLKTLQAAHLTYPGRAGDTARVYRELELS